MTVTSSPAYCSDLYGHRVTAKVNGITHHASYLLDVSFVLGARSRVPYWRKHLLSCSRSAMPSVRTASTRWSPSQWRCRWRCWEARGRSTSSGFERTSHSASRSLA